MSTEKTIYGTPVVNGLAYAPAAWVSRFQIPKLDATPLPESERETETTRFDQAAATVSARLAARAKQAVGTASDVLAAQSELSADPGYRQMVHQAIKAGTPAAVAALQTTEKFCAMFEKAGGLMAERTTDLRDICTRVVAELLGEPEPGVPQLREPSVLLADDLAPADTAGLNPEMILALVTEQGGSTSHTSIIARQLGIPCIVAMRELGCVPPGEKVFVDASLGSLTLGAPVHEVLPRVEADVRAREAIRNWAGPARLASGEEVELLANVQDGAGAQKAASGYAQGVGLFRTELCFLDSTHEPTLDEQAAVYREVLTAFPNQKVVTRTLDSGSDKPIAWATLEQEPNPALGVRGLRTTGLNQGLFTRQLDAIAAASKQHSGKNWVMVPMVSTLPEVKWVTKLIRERGLVAGIMVEVPAAAIMIDHFLEEVDFVSIGTNDLTQYVMAADRMNANLATYTDSWQPAVLTLIARVARVGQEKGKPVGVCGEAAADPVLACVLIGMGVTSLSMAATAIPGVGAQLGAVTLDQCQAAAAVVLQAADAGDARARARRALGLR
ncbi:phosphoenolpyruvate--protein phosphotransferase [Mobiluncus mulieris]|uniref:Phosphoenolpyruvate-protein phosphotransferase n=1 Tax=Mobiluncus mulieris TaxID=2052 RepID=A0A848RML4_9ACTO|nr:phosphoenolpyruvate--protein phosphotransferase [Mobiluncus mulieris]MCU9970749.1 phosphoenolpyruvate--protein phosphotransferase [Mobiluncus mulieris]NMW63333.1 phosphoenolpyruvate--protein phosphotransferase [Mobiluncus mulieris]NMW90198.1 phosphoenolpyruvate--protein phosphotransferase [Mobiluncus mulieris]NMW92705.1 phosphoenolpyruvate--protein phosphotransferase [Mobiluncus mulieris]